MIMETTNENFVWTVRYRGGNNAKTRYVKLGQSIGVHIRCQSRIEVVGSLDLDLAAAHDVDAIEFHARRCHLHGLELDEGEATLGIDVDAKDGIFNVRRRCMAHGLGNGVMEEAVDLSVGESLGDVTDVKTTGVPGLLRLGGNVDAATAAGPSPRGGSRGGSNSASRGRRGHQGHFPHPLPLQLLGGRLDVELGLALPPLPAADFDKVPLLVPAAEADHVLRNTAAAAATIASTTGRTTATPSAAPAATATCATTTAMPSKGILPRTVISIAAIGGSFWWGRSRGRRDVAAAVASSRGLTVAVGHPSRPVGNAAASWRRGGAHGYECTE
mmetsp:Transcript_29400/g.64782  ORF Transcript_29400/g.64782 Transcript_29400/m.64782 type:complete len:329 (+) Transcript_29400:1416-2402(+)